MNRDKVVNYWLSTARQDIETAEILFKSKKYHYALFFCHLSIEKTLKAIVVKTTKSAPPLIHDLIRLAEKVEIPIDIKHKNELAEITTFNIETRYDDYKLSFYKKANRQYASKYLNITKEILKWLEKYI